MAKQSKSQVKITTNLDEFNSLLYAALHKVKELSDALEKINGFELEFKPELIKGG